MSLRDIDNDEEAENITPRKKKGGLFKLQKNIKIGVALLIIGLCAGVLLGHFYVEPIIDSIDAGSCAQCIVTKDILTKENDCLYNYIDDAKMVVDGCSS